MSQPGELPLEQPKPEPTLIEQEGSVPETVTPPEPVEEAPEPAPEAPKEPEKEAQPEKPKRTPWYMERIGELTRQKSELQKKLEAKPAEAPPTEQVPDQEQAILQAAERIVARRDFDTRAKQLLEAGNKEFGREDFAEKCNLIADLGFGDRADFMEIMTDPDVIQDGHKLLSALAENPDEAQKIARLPAAKMAAALVRYATTMSKPDKPVSSAPAPIKPIAGTAKPSAPADTDSMEAWIAKRNATARTTAGGKPNTHH